MKTNYRDRMFDEEIERRLNSAEWSSMMAAGTIRAVRARRLSLAGSFLFPVAAAALLFAVVSFGLDVGEKVAMERLAFSVFNDII